MSAFWVICPPSFRPRVPLSPEPSDLQNVSCLAWALSSFRPVEHLSVHNLRLRLWPVEPQTWACSHVSLAGHQLVTSLASRAWAGCGASRLVKSCPPLSGPAKRRRGSLRFGSGFFRPATAVVGFGLWLSDCGQFRWPWRCSIPPPEELLWFLNRVGALRSVG